MIAYLTKHALTKGIQQQEVSCMNSQTVIIHFGSNMSQLIYKPDWHETREEAIKQANIMRTQKINELNKKINQLNKLKF